MRIIKYEYMFLIVATVPEDQEQGPQTISGACHIFDDSPRGNSGESSARCHHYTSCRCNCCHFCDEFCKRTAAPPRASVPSLPHGCASRGAQALPWSLYNDITLYYVTYTILALTMMMLYDILC